MGRGYWEWREGNIGKKMREEEGMRGGKEEEERGTEEKIDLKSIDQKNRRV